MSPVFLVNGCSADRSGRLVDTEAPDSLRSPLAVARPEWEVREWEVEDMAGPGGRITALAFRAGGGLVVMLQDSPRTIWEFMFQLPAYPSIQALSDEWPQRHPAPAIGFPTEVVGVTADGAAWFLDSETGRVTSQNVAGYRATITQLGHYGFVRRACALGERAIAFLDDARPGWVFIQRIEPPADEWTLRFPREVLDNPHVDWTDLRFGGSLEGPCVLWTPRMSTVVVVSDSETHALGPFIEPPRAESWYANLTRRVTRSSRVLTALDATSFPGGVAILFGGRTAHAGSLVDFYDRSGKYIETMLLVRRALRVAASRYRLFVLSQHQDSVWLASYVLPAAVSPRTAPRETKVRVPPPPYARRGERGASERTGRR
ncbi:MAG: hypothetical protein ACE5HT_07355 [Gemmatimonadales bacterium]